jgi:Cys-rich repeat protein
MTRLIGRCLALLAVLAVAGCNNSTQVGSVLVTSQDIKAAQGGTIAVSAAQSADLAGARLVVPANSLTTNTTITVSLDKTSLVTSTQAAGPVGVFGPTGTTFTDGATLSLPFKLSATQKVGGLFIQVVEDDGTKSLIAGRDLLVDSASGLVTFKVKHFTRYQPGARDVCTADSDCAAGQSCVGGVCEATPVTCDQAGGKCFALTANGVQCAVGYAANGTAGMCAVGAGCCTPVQPGPCVADADCAAGESCVAGTCVPGTTCEAAGGKCGSLTANGVVCDAGYVADGTAGTCAPGGGCCVQTQPVCTADRECPAGQVCQNGLCVAVCLCASNADCPQGALCKNCQCELGCSTDRDCAAGQTCVNGVCKATCVAKTCADLGYSCGTQSDGCGGNLSCGSCAAGQTCANGVCTAGPACTTDRDCAAGQACVNGVCQGSCVAKTCAQLGYTCGAPSDGCSGTLSCGACAAGQVCEAGVCKAGTVCRTNGDCAAGQTCVGGVCTAGTSCTADRDCATGQACVNGVCQGGCVAKTCTDLGYSCGTQSDGCGGNLSCGTCAAGQLCTDGVCTAGTVCRTNGDCTAGQTCVNGVCQGSCLPKTCVDLGYSCGAQDDGCGGTVSCGSCAAGMTCDAGTCTAGTKCRANGDCAAGQVCVGGLCQGGAGCTTDAECQVDCGGSDCVVDACQFWACVNGSCQAEALADGAACDDGKACTIGDHCLAGQCTPTSDTCGCGTNSDCAAGQTCVNGVCQGSCVAKTCTDLGYSCGTQDDGCGGTLTCGSCAAGQICSAGVCNAAVRCTADKDCASGQHCISNICQ